ncbi:MAG: metalloregulator ArsR/SmtB family transcription factor [Lachnospiraceae bacterium]|jgi:ArsR family transcriptional regulator|nr:metalloregulator ArsR/SmtB family transcription factor [Lachnospiraceae bacterium]
MKREAEVCSTIHVHEETVSALTEKMPSSDTFRLAAEFFKALSDETRTKIIWALDQQELCVCDLAAALNMTVSAISHQLATLRRANLVRNRREGKEVFYSLADDHVRRMLESGIEHTQEL